MMLQNHNPIIFLDFDGPLSSFRNTIADDLLTFDPVAIRFLNTICNITGAKIVCTSTRSALHSPELHEEAKQLFHDAGIDLNHIHDEWSVNVTNCNNRKQNILDFLKQHPEVKQYVIIDDEHVDFPYLVHVCENEGILSDHMYQICEVLDIKVRDLLQFNQTKRKSLTP
jgi:hypothetical protein